MRDPSDPVPLSDTPLERPCKCGYGGPHETRDGRPPHGQQVNCGKCGTFLGYLKKPENLHKRPANTKHRAYWMNRMAGVLRCALCGRTEADGYPIDFAMDHIWAVEDGGPEGDERNTMPLCRDCHTTKNALRALRLHARGSSARTSSRGGREVA